MSHSQWGPRVEGFTSFVRKATGMPWQFWDREVVGVLMSAWASTHSTLVLGRTDKRPEMEPKATVWSPPRSKGKWPCFTHPSTEAAMLRTPCATKWLFFTEEEAVRG